MFIHALGLRNHPISRFRNDLGRNSRNSRVFRLFNCENDMKISFSGCFGWCGRFQHDRAWHRVSSSYHSRIDSGFGSGFGFEEMRLFLAAELYQVASLSNSSTRTEFSFRLKLHQKIWNCIWNQDFQKRWFRIFETLAYSCFEYSSLNVTWKYDYDSESRKWA